MSPKTEWTWNEIYQEMFDKAKAIVKEDTCMKFYDETKPLCIETDESGIGIGASLLQTRSHTSCHGDEVPDSSILRPIAFTSKNLTGAEKKYSNIDRKALGKLYCLEKLHHYCFVREVSLITYHKLLISIFRKDVAAL